MLELSSSSLVFFVTLPLLLFLILEFLTTFEISLVVLFLPLEEAEYDKPSEFKDVTMNFGIPL